MRRWNLTTGSTAKVLTLLFFASTLLASLPEVTLAAAPAEIVCITCHSKLPEKYSAPVSLWQGSIHAENGIDCNGCHGGDPQDAVNAMSPARGFLGAPQETDIPAFCGRCHVGVLKDYLGSLHGEALGSGGPTCVTCHSNHRVLKASLDLINEKDCSRCHTFERAAKIRTVMGETEKRILAIDAEITAFKAEGIATDALEKGLFSIRNTFHTLFHTVDIERVSKETAGIQAELQKLDDQLRRIDAKQNQRKLIGAIAVAGALLLALLFYLLRKTYDEPES